MIIERYKNMIFYSVLGGSLPLHHLLELIHTQPTVSVGVKLCKDSLYLGGSQLLGDLRNISEKIHDEELSDFKLGQHLIN